MSRAALPAVGGAHSAPVDLERLLEDRADLLARIERAIGILEDDLDIAPQSLEGSARLEARDVDAVDDQGARGRRLDHGDDAGKRRLAAAGFADDRECLPGLEREADAVDGLQDQRRGERPPRQGIVAPEIVGPENDMAGGLTPPPPPAGWDGRPADRATADSGRARNPAFSPWRGGTLSTQRSVAKRQRGENRQPDGRSN